MQLIKPGRRACARALTTLCLCLCSILLGQAALAAPPAAEAASPRRSLGASAGAITGVDVGPRLEAAKALVADGSAAGLTALWLLAHDPSHEVVGAALEAALARCQHEPHPICLATLSFFMDGEAEDGQLAWRARTTLLAEQPALARLYASRETKLDVVTLLAGRLSQGQAYKPWLAALELLASDPDADVQEAAGAVLLQLER